MTRVLRYYSKYTMYRIPFRIQARETSRFALLLEDAYHQISDGHEEVINDELYTRTCIRSSSPVYTVRYKLTLHYYKTFAVFDRHKL